MGTSIGAYGSNWTMMQRSKLTWRLLNHIHEVHGDMQVGELHSPAKRAGTYWHSQEVGEL